VPLPDKAKALLLLIQKGDDSAHKKVLAIIVKKTKETETLIAKHQGFVKEYEDSLRDDKALLAKTTGDTSGIEKRMALTKRALKLQDGYLALFRQHIDARNKEAQAWKDVLRLIEQARKAAKKP
jgi:hypothetical protein